MRDWCRPMRAFLMIAAILAVTTATSMPLSQVESLSHIQKAEINYRLPHDVKPDHYKIKITPQNEDGEFVRFTGEVKINAFIKTKTSQITLHKADNINIENVEVVDAATQETLKYKSLDWKRDSEFYEIVLNTELVENNGINISITYTASFPGGLYGFYKSTYTYTSEKGDKQEDVLLVTQFQPTHARKAFPCFDEPGFKATFEISLVVPPGYDALSNTVGKAVASTKNAQQRETDSQEIVFEKTPLMSTYLVAFIVYKEETYKSTATASGNIPFRTWASVDEIAAGSGALSQTEGPKIIEQLEKYTGIPYTTYSKKIDQAAIPDFSFGAMENWGLVTYRETALLYDSKEHTQTAKKRVSELIAHELTHQWFGNLVTMEWWSSAWLNEGFATYFEYYIANILHPSWRMMERLVVDEQLTAFGADGTLTASPLTNEKVNSPDEAAGHFGTITYSKGGSVVRMFSNILGEDKFQTALRNYLKDNALTAVTPEKLFDALSKAAGNVGLPNNVELTDIFESWTNSTGFPIINVLRKDTEVALTQERFLPYGSSSKDTYNVPLTLVYNDTEISEKSVWFLSSQKEVSMEIPENVSWIFVPTTGYFRVNYDKANWLLLTEYLQDESLDDVAIEPLERAILIDNALNLARINKLEYSSAIPLLSYLSNEVDYIPWTVAFSGLNYLHRMLADESDIFNNFLLHIIENVYEELGFKVVDKNDDASHIEHVHRANVLNWACRAGHSECITTAVEQLRNYLEKPQSAKVAPDLRSVVYCYGVKHNDTLWTKLWKTLLDTDDATERSLLISSLGCSKASSTLYLYLESAVLGNVIRTQDIASVFSAVYSNPEGVNAALRFLEFNLPKIEERASTVMNGIPNIIRGISQYITNEEQKQRLADIGGRLSNPEHQAVATAGVATAEVNLDWAKRHKETVLGELEKWTPGEPVTVPITTESSVWGLRPTVFSLAVAVVLPALSLTL